MQNSSPNWAEVQLDVSAINVISVSNSITTLTTDSNVSKNEMI